MSQPTDRQEVEAPQPKPWDQLDRETQVFRLIEEALSFRVRYVPATRRGAAGSDSH